MKRVRKRLGLSQGRAARLAHVSPSYMCQVERGTRTPSRRLAEKLEQVYRTTPGHFTRRYQFPRRGPKQVDPRTAEALRDLLAALSIDRTLQQPAPRSTPERQWADWRGNVENPLWPVAIHLGRGAQEEVKLLESRQPSDAFWRVLNGMPFDSWTEKRFLVKLGLAGGEFVRLAPARLGVPSRVVNTKGIDTRHRPQPAMVVRYMGVSAVFWPQRPVQGTTLWKLDTLVVATWQGKRLTFNVELDNPKTHDPRRDEYRTRDVGLPTLRYQADVVNAMGFMNRLFSDIQRVITLNA